jgi:hypothetical protein
VARGAGRVVVGFLPELLVTLALVAGWLLLTWGIAALLVWQVWPISVGLFLLGCCGWRFLARLFGRGLYALTLTREDR